MHKKRDRNEILNYPTVHNRVANPEDLSKRRIIFDVQIRARTPTKPPKRLLSDCLSRRISSVSRLIPSYNSLQRNVKVIRPHINLSITIPVNAAHQNIPEQYKISFRNEHFLLYNGREKEGERFIHYAAPPKLIILSLSSNIYFDPNFQSFFFYYCLLITENRKMY
ncbi:hypothetical protein HZS_6590 [Henneguya salminicola]|nr:hypothetical protein HZS_6590 [Henneguya salminicola]